VLQGKRTRYILHFEFIVDACYTNPQCVCAGAQADGDSLQLLQQLFTIRTVVFVTSRSFLRKLLLDSVVKVCRDAVVKQIASIVSFSIRQGPAAFRCHSTSVAKS